MGKEDIQPASMEDFFYWINERHRIYENRFVKGEDKPWTDDVILQSYKFTNVFRQLDTGTIALNKMLGKWFNSDIKLADMEIDDAIDILFNVVWYRLFNVAAHAEDIGFTKHEDHDKVLLALKDKKRNGEKVFTSAHMTTASGFHCETQGKIYGSFVGAIGIAEDFGVSFINYIFHNQSMKAVTKKLQELPSVGPFIAYEIACDLRFTPLLSGAEDIMTWANLGPGARRGLMRLGMPVSNESMVELYEMAVSEELIDHHVAEHLPWNEKQPPFELREIEHSLCEFDKYMRVKTGAGAPRQKYKGV